MFSGEEVESPAEEDEKITDPEELADIKAEREEMEAEAFRAERWPHYVEYVDSLVSNNKECCFYNASAKNLCKIPYANDHTSPKGYLMFMSLCRIYHS